MSVVEGITDLVFRDDDGALVVVDYKTDVRVSATTTEAHWAQIYADLLRTAAGERVSTLQLMLCRDDGAVALSRSAWP